MSSSSTAVARVTLLGALALAACAPPPAEPGIILGFTATPKVIVAGEVVQLTWRSLNAGGCLLAPLDLVLEPSGQLNVAPDETTTYILTCNGARAVNVVTVAPRVSIVSFTATPAETVPDGNVTLAWQAAHAQTCSISPGFEEVEAEGSRQLNPTQTTTWTLSCTGQVGLAVATATVTVVPATSLDVPTNVAVAAEDGALRVTWTQGAGSANLYFAEEPGVTQAGLGALRGGFVVRRVASPFVLSGLVNGRAYHLRLSAVSGTLETALSGEVSGTPTGPTTGTDPYYLEQWHLSSAIGEDVRAEPAWTAGVRGEGVLAAVVDEGIDFGHEDLKQNVAPGRSHDYIGNAPLRWAEHGTCVAGLLGARDLNGKGVRGVAPRVALASYNLLQDLTSANEFDAMTRGKDVVAVSNNSWGDAYDATGLVTWADPQWLAGVTEGATTGRGGKGVAYFWASGNGGDTAEPYQDDSNYDAQANSRFVFAISGVGRDGKRAPYSEDGANVLVAAPTEGTDLVGLTTTDLSGALGYNDGNTGGEHQDTNYSRTMSGTSASTPVAAGVGALILSVRPELSYRDVRRVLALSARKNDATSGGWSTNGAGLPIHHAYGFGVVNAEAAVVLARTITPVGPEVRFETPLASPGLPVPDNSATGASSVITVASSGISRIEFVEAEVTLAHPRSGDLNLTLAKAGGASSTLHHTHTCEPDQGAEVCADLDGYVFGTVRHLDEGADGAWTLTVKDGRGGQTGTLTSWRLRIYGRQ